MQSNLARPAIATAAFAALLCAGSPVLAETLSYKADLKATSEVPPNDSRGTGMVDAAYDTISKKLTWTATYAGMTGPAAAAHFHGPAAAGSNAGVAVPVKGDLASPIKGEAVLTEAQAADLQTGRWYFNIHTSAHKDGELRGQVTKK